jgi:anti-sigma factor ChrR (cupin superfamily)
MARHEAVSDEIRERAALYSVGMLDPAESGSFERHLGECGVCRGEVRAYAGATAALAFAIPETRPSPRVRQEVLRRTMPARALMRADEGAWQATQFPGVEVKQLFVDPATGNVSSLVRLQAGARYPAHRHAGLEHCYVLQGDLAFTDHTLHAGDYEVNAPSTDHSPVTSQGGCLLLLITSQADQVFA